MSFLVTRCAHPYCNTTVTDWNAVQCGHGITTCDGCLSEEACPECGVAADEAGEGVVTDDPHIDWNVDSAALRAALSRPPVAPRPPVQPCRCGWRDERVAGPPPREPGPVADLTGCDVALTAASAQRTCLSCGHPIGTGAPCVTHYLGGAAFYRYFHPTCVTGVTP